jgi:sulfoxide reductase heme-binding subunit YedZ
MIRAPWNERNGRFSPVKAMVFAALFLPALWIISLLETGALAPKPVTEMIHRTGDWAVRLILLSLLITPLRKLAQWPKAIAVRRMVGVAAFAYALAHLCLYVVDQGYDLAHVASEIALRFYLTIGFVTLLGLAALTATSTDAMIRRLGSQRWNALHRIIYALAALALFHYYLQSKADVSDPVLMTGLFLMLMFYRALVKRLPLWAASVASVALGTGMTTLVEAAWYAIRRHYPFWEVLGANIDPDMFPRPAFYVAVVGLVALVVMVARNYRPSLRLAPAE